MADKPVHEVVGVDAALDALVSPTSSDVYEAVDPFSDQAVAAVAAKRALEGGGGGSQPVSCLLACNTDFDIHDIANYDVLWDALYDNLWDLDPLAAIPAGLGLTFAFDGTSSLVVPTEVGIWSLSYSATRAGDIDLVCSFVTGIGVSFPWNQDRAGTGAGTNAQGVPYMAGTVVAPFPAGTQITHQVAVTSAAAANPSNVTQVYLSIVRFA